MRVQGAGCCTGENDCATRQAKGIACYHRWGPSRGSDARQAEAARGHARYPPFPPLQPHHRNDSSFSMQEPQWSTPMCSIAVGRASGVRVMCFELVWRCGLYGNHITRMVNGKGAVTPFVRVSCPGHVCTCYTAKSPGKGFIRKPYIQ